MRLGAPPFGDESTPDTWIAALQKKRYRAAYFPLGPEADAATADAYARAACKADIVIAEVGAWSNPLSPDDSIRAAAIRKCKVGLALADRIGARCCVNIAGRRNEGSWDGPDPMNLTDENFDVIVQLVREIIDEVRPTRTFYTLECMPWMYPDSAASYARILKAIDRKAFGVHLDPVNLVSSPQLYFSTGAMIREFCRELGPQIRSCHAKDTMLGKELTTHLSECRPGTGGLDYRALLTELARLDPDMPLMIEHLPDEREYDLAAQHIRQVASQCHISL
jgi:sugar phosphate isomerase/epimerase